jgi:hypothetical protein
MSGHETSGLNPLARSKSLAAIFSHTDLILKKLENIPEVYRQTKIFGRQWRPEISRPALCIQTPQTLYKLWVGHMLYSNQPKLF